MPDTAVLTPATSRVVDPAQQLRTTMAAVRVAFTWFGVRKTLSREQTQAAAQSFGAEGEFLSAAKKLLDTRHPAYQAVTAVRGQVHRLWKQLSLPYPEPGIRLIRQTDIPTFDVQLTSLRAELAEAVAQLDAHYGELQAAARRRLGQLYDRADYPTSLVGLFRVDHDYPSVEPPDYLRQLSPALFRQEQARVQARFAEAVQLAETAFLTEFSQLVAHLAERLAGSEDGRPKVFRDSAVENLVEFFERFRTLNVHSSAELDALVAEAQQIVRGVEPQTLRNQTTLRQAVARELTHVATQLDTLLVDRPRRQLVRRREPQVA